MATSGGKGQVLGEAEPRPQHWRAPLVPVAPDRRLAGIRGTAEFGGRIRGTVYLFSGIRGTVCLFWQQESAVRGQL